MKFGEDAIYVDFIEEKEYSDDIFNSVTRINEDKEFLNPHFSVWFYKTRMELDAYLDVGWLVIPAKLPTAIPESIKNLKGYYIVLRYSFSNMQMTNFVSVTKWILEEKNIPDIVKEEVKIKLREHFNSRNRYTFRFVIFIPDDIFRKYKILPIATMIIRAKNTEGKYIERDEYDSLLSSLGINKNIIDSLKDDVDGIENIDVVAKIKFKTKLLNKGVINDVMKSLLDVREESLKINLKTSSVVEDLKQEFEEKLKEISEKDITLDHEKINKILEDLKSIKKQEKKINEVLTLFKTELGNKATIELIDMNGVSIASMVDIMGMISALDFNTFMNKLELQEEINQEIIGLIKQLISLEGSYIKNDVAEANKATNIISRLAELVNNILPEVI